MGYAVARAAAARGHDVRLIAGPVSLSDPAGVPVVRIVSAQDMCGAVEEYLAWCDALVMSAAVADWRPRRTLAHKLKKSDGAMRRLELERTPDILLTVRDGKGDRLFVGFAAETDDLRAEARRKLAEKGLDLVVANDVTRSDAGFEVDTNEAVLFAADGGEEALPLMSKDALGQRIVEWLERHAVSVNRP
jgi:phosphopantothenoylcysteine decarboxylase/phosphopantothenate--cysteine ligase